MKNIILSIIAVITISSSYAQQHKDSDHYIWPKDTLVSKKLTEWQQLKFGLLMHWGTYSQWGIVESWSLCPENEGWCQRKGPYAYDWYEYKKQYENLQKTFNPTKFYPEKWANAAKEAGMKYVVFTTKHHDGFCMFDTKQTDYKITDPKTPFSSNPRSNVTKEIFNVFRDQQFMIGAYFSKPDWHSTDFWWPYFPPKDRNPSYNPALFPERWQSFKDFTYNQINELTTDYGKVDILWLDGGWVRPLESIDTTVSWQKAIPYKQDIDMPRIEAMARKNQPGILVVDRTVSGEFENYVTPEQQIPNKYLPYPWESCITMGDSWSYIPIENYKPTYKIIHQLTEIVSKGGSMLLNISPGPDGEWHKEAYERLKEIGQWMKINGEAIYGTSGDNLIGAQDNFVFTLKGKIIYAIYQMHEKNVKMPEIMVINNITISENTKISLLGSSGNLKWKYNNKKLVICIPLSIQQNPPCDYAWVIKIMKE